MMKRKMKKILAGLLCIAAVTVPASGVSAADAEEEAKQSYALPVQSNEVENWPEGPAVYGKSAIVIDADTKAVLYAKNIDDEHYPASITKVMTALLAAENGDLETGRVTISQESVDFLEPGDAYIGMRPGEEISLTDALYGVLLASANEVSYAVAENIGNTLSGTGTGYEKFVAAMNDRAGELGATHTHFVNPHGLQDENHYTSAHDMALISSELFSHPELMEIMQTYEHTIGPTNLETESRTFQQRHEMLVNWNDHYYEYCVGGKTGYTDEAGNTLITLADNGKMHLVCVEMETRGQHIYDDTRSILDYAFENFTRQEVESSVLEQARKEAHATVTETEPVYVSLPADASQEDLKFETGEENGESMLYLTYEGQTVGKAKADVDEKAVARKEKEEQGTASVLDTIKNVFEGRQWIVIAAAAAVIIVAVVILILVFRRRRRRSFLRTSRRQKRLERQRRRRMKRAARRSRRRGRKRW